MLNYSFPKQFAIVVATMGVHNFLRWFGVVDEAFTRVETDRGAIEVELTNDVDEIPTKVSAKKMPHKE